MREIRKDLVQVVFNNNEQMAKENIWKRRDNILEEEAQLKDLVVLSPISSSRSPFSASRADRGLLFRIEWPFRYIWIQFLLGMSAVVLTFETLIGKHEMVSR